MTLFAMAYHGNVVMRPLLLLGCLAADSVEGYKKRVEELTKTLKALEDMDEEAGKLGFSLTFNKHCL